MKEPANPTAAAEEEPVLPPGEACRAWDDFDLSESPGFFRRHRVVVSLLVAALGGGGVWFWSDLFPKGKSAPARRESMVVVNVPPPPPPPVQPIPPPPPPPEQKMIEQTPVENEPKPEPAPDEPPPADVATGIVGNGPPDGFGLSGRSGSGLPGGTGSNRSAQRSRWGWYATQVQSRVQQAIVGNRVTGYSNLRADVKIWTDSSGRITRATIASSTGNPTLDAALRDQVLAGLQLSEPPPEGMPMPITLRVNVRRPN